MAVAAICGLFGTGKSLSFGKEPATVTSKGQIILPKAIRQVLGVDAGDKVVFELREDDQVVVTRWEAEHAGPAIGAFLDLLKQDIRTGRRLRGLPDDLARAMPANVGGAACSHEPIEGQVALMQRHGWALLFHEGVIEQLRKVQVSAVQASESEPQEFDGNANAKLFRALSQWMMDVVPGDPSRDAFRHCNIAKPTPSNWRCAKIGGRFRLFFRYEAKAKVIVFAAHKDWTAVMAASREWSEALSSRIEAGYTSVPPKNGLAEIDATLMKVRRQRMTRPRQER